VKHHPGILPKMVIPCMPPEQSLIICCPAFSAFQPQSHSRHENTEDSKYRKDVNHFHLCPSPDGKPLHYKDIKEDSKDNPKHQISFRSSLLYLFFGQIGRISKSDKVFLIEPKRQKHQNKVHQKSCQNPGNTHHSRQIYTFRKAFRK